MSKTVAILMAAGLGSRMLPLTEKIPKPLINVNGIPMIETMIEGLQKCGIQEFYIVIGYLAEQFEVLDSKYDNIHLVKNEDYYKINNISSIYAVRDILGTADCFICESDIFVRDSAIFNLKPEQSCYFGKWVEGYSDDWVFDIDENGQVTGIHKKGTNKYNMTGVCFLKKSDSKILKVAIEEMYGKPGYETMFWDEVLDKNLSRISMKIREVQDNQLIEIDTVEELQQVDDSYR